jgi:hypothetical protein
MRRIGIDVGGTNTDAVVLDDGLVVHAIKTPTTPDVTTGILTALAGLTDHPEVAGRTIDGVVVGTTHFVNAVVQRRDLTRVAAVRIGLPASASLPPFCDWPEDLAELVRGEVFMLEGGHEYDGRPIVPFDEIGMRRAARRIRESGIRSVAVAAIFSPLDPSCEERAREILSEVCPDAAVTLSHDLGRIGLLERENAALLNAALIDLARATVAGFAAAIAASGITAPLYLTQNDGTVTQAVVATALPVMSFASGATNSMRGAAFTVGHRGRDGDRCRRHDDRCRPAPPRVSARGELGRRGGRRPHALPHAGSVVDRPRWREHRRTRSAYRRTEQRRLSVDGGCAGLRWRYLDRNRYRGRSRYHANRQRRSSREFAVRSRARGARCSARKDRGCGRPNED